MTVPVASLSAYMSVRGAAQARQDILAVQQGFGLAGESAVAAGGAFDRSEVALAGAARSAGTAATRSNQLRVAQLGVVAATERYNAVLADENASVARLATAEASLIRANERVAATTRTAAAEQAKQAGVVRAGVASQGEFAAASTRMGAATGGTVKQLGLMFGGFELLKAGIDVGKQAAAFQQQMRLIQTNANASAGEVDRMTKGLLDMAGSVATSPEKLAVALYHVEQNGIRGGDALDVVRTAAKGAKIGLADVEETTNSMTAAVASGIPGVKNLDSAMGALLATVGTGDMKMSDLNEALGSGLLVIVKQYGLSLRDVGAALAVFGDNNIRGADAATMLRMAVQALAKPAAGGAKALKEIGINADQLRTDMQQGGLNKAILDLDSHLRASGKSGKETGGILLDAFGKKQAAGISVLLGQVGRLEIKYRELDEGSASIGAKWAETTKNASFQFKQLAVETDAAAIVMSQKALPVVTDVAHVVGVALPLALRVGRAGLEPFVAGWHELSDVLDPVVHSLGAVADVLGPVVPILGGAAAAAVTMWVAFKGYQAAVFAVNAVRDAVAGAGVMARNRAADFQLWRSELNGVAAQSAATSAVMQAEFAAVAAGATAEAAAIDKAAMNEAIAYADMTAASKSASDEQVAAADRAAAAATLAARESQLAAVTTAAAAEEAAAAVNVAGATARVGWAGVAGPIGLAALGVFTIISMFHRSSTASKEATAAAKAYADALKDDKSPAGFVDAIQKQLTDNNVPQKVAELNKALGSTRYTAQQFASAIEHGNPAIGTLRDRLEAVIKSGTMVSVSVGRAARAVVTLSPAAKTATTLLKDLNDQYSGLTKATKKDLLDTKAFAGVSSSLDTTAQKLGVVSGTAKTYASMVGILGDKNGVTTTSQNELNKAVAGVASAYNNATATGSEYLKSLQSFASSEKTAADRGAMIGAVLKASNGDALSFAGALASTTTAFDTMADAFKSQRDQLAQQSADQAKAAKDIDSAHRAEESSTARVSAAEARLAQVRSNRKSTAADIKSAEAAVTSAQNASKNSADRLGEAQAAAGKAGALAYADTERAAIKFTGSGKSLTASIDTTAKGAGDLISQLQGMQTAGMGAATAMYQNEVATKHGNTAALDAYNIYRSKTYQTLLDQANKLGLTRDQAKALADQYFSIKDSGDIKKAIGMIGDNKVVDVLNRIGQLLAKLTGTQWDIPVSVSVHKGLPNHQAAQTGAGGQVSGPGFADGGPITGYGPKGVDTVPMLGAVGEFMMRDKAVDKYGMAFMKAVNAGTYNPASQTRASSASSPVVAGGRHVRIDKFVQEFHYPEPEQPSRTTSRSMEMAAYALSDI